MKKFGAIFFFTLILSANAGADPLTALSLATKALRGAQRSQADEIVRGFYNRMASTALEHKAEGFVSTNNSRAFVSSAYVKENGTYQTLKIQDGRVSMSEIKVPGASKTASWRVDHDGVIKRRRGNVFSTEKFGLLDFRGQIVRYKMHEEGELFRSQGKNFKYVSEVRNDRRAVNMKLSGVSGNWSAVLPAQFDGQIVHYEFLHQAEGLPRLLLWTWNGKNGPQKVEVALEKQTQGMKVRWDRATFSPLSSTEVASALAKHTKIEPLAPRVASGTQFRAAQ
jgi:hypothetical protein